MDYSLVHRYKLPFFSRLSSLDGHHLWETEAKVDKDASKPVSDTVFISQNS